MTNTLPIILQNYINRNCINEYRLEDVVKGKFGDVELKDNQVAFLYEVYFEYKGDCSISKDKEILLSVKQIECNKTSYTDDLDQVKVFRKICTTVIKDNFTFAGNGKNPHIKYLLLTILDKGK